MGDQLVSSAVTVMLAIVGLAIVAVLVSKNANTSTVVKAFSGGFSDSLLAAEAPVSGSGIGGINSTGTSNSSGYMYN